MGTQCECQVGLHVVDIEADPSRHFDKLTDPELLKNAN